MVEPSKQKTHILPFRGDEAPVPGSQFKVGLRCGRLGALRRATDRSDRPTPTPRPSVRYERRNAGKMAACLWTPVHAQVRLQRGSRARAPPFAHGDSKNTMPVGQGFARNARLRRAGRGSTSKRSMIPSNACDRPRGDVSRRGGVSAARAPRSPPRDARALFALSKISPPRTGPDLAHLRIDAGRHKHLSDRRGRDQERRGVQAALEDHPHLPRPQRCVPPPRSAARPRRRSQHDDSSRSFVSSQLVSSPPFPSNTRQA